MWRVLLSYARPFRLALVVGAVLSLATGATGLALPLVVRELIAGLGAGRSVSNLVLLMTVLVVANAAIGAFGSFMLERTGVLTLLATVALMALLDAVLLGITLLVLGLAAAVIGLLVPRIGRAFRRAQESVGLMGAALERMFGAFRRPRPSSTRSMRPHCARPSPRPPGPRPCWWSRTGCPP